VILRKRPLLEPPRHVAAPDVHLSQSLELDERNRSHDRLGAALVTPSSAPVYFKITKNNPPEVIRKADQAMREDSG
jgi:hypothetical protein